MLRNGGAAVRHYADVARGGRGARPSSWSPGLTIGVELLSGFLEGIDLRPSEVDALLAGEGDDLVAYVRSLRAVMAVGIPPLPGTRVEPVRIRWGDARHSAAWLIPPRRETRDGTRPVILWLHGGAFILCGTSTHARLLSSLALAADARVLSVEYPLAPDQGVVDALRAATDAYRWLVDDAGGGVDPRDVVVGGDSAGGHLALGLVRELATARGCGVGPDGASTRAGRVEMPAGVVLMSPWLDPGRRLDETVAAWEEAASSSVDYLRGVKDSMEAVERLVFGDETDETESSPPRCLLDADLWTRAVGTRRSRPCSCSAAGRRCSRESPARSARRRWTRGGRTWRCRSGWTCRTCFRFSTQSRARGGGDSVRGGVRGAGHGEMSPSRRGDGAVEASIVRGGGGVVRRERVATNAAA